MLKDISIIITTFLRDGYLFECIKRIKQSLPECPIIVVDDGHITNDKLALSSDLTYIQLPFDSGLPAKRNAAVKALQTKYALMASDDFDFGPIQVKEGIERLLKVLDSNPNIDVAGGRVANNRYEGFLNYEPGYFIKETFLEQDGTKSFYPVELTVNYFLARKEVLAAFQWDERMKIGGEHGDWFLELKLNKKQVVWVPDVNINELLLDCKHENPEYSKYRSRAGRLGHQIFLEKRNIKEYFSFSDPSILIAVVSCEKYDKRKQAQLNTWVMEFMKAGYDVQFFNGKRLDVPDDYLSLPMKTRALCQWALDHNYKHMLKVDDDAYIWLNRFVVIKNDYAGILRDPNDFGRTDLDIPDKPKGTYKYSYAAGGACWLSARSMKIIAGTPTGADWAEDRFVGNTLAKEGIKAIEVNEYKVAYPPPILQHVMRNPTILVQIEDGDIDIIIGSAPPRPNKQRTVDRHNIIERPRLVQAHRPRETKVIDRRRIR